MITRRIQFGNCAFVSSSSGWRNPGAGEYIAAAGMHSRRQRGAEKHGSLLGSASLFLILWALHALKLLRVATAAVGRLLHPLSARNQADARPRDPCARLEETMGSESGRRCAITFKQPNSGILSAHVHARWIGGASPPDQASTRG
jgi:hypothetical protein